MGLRRDEKPINSNSNNPFEGFVLLEKKLGTLYFTSPTGDGTAILRGHLSHGKV